MLKKAFIVLGLLLLSGMVWADISIVTETTKTTLQESSAPFDLGEVQPGETIALTIASDTGYETIEGEWSQLIIPKDSLPRGWSAVDSEQDRKTLTAFISIPQDEELGAFQFKARAVNKENLIEAESINLRVYVKRGLLLASIPETVQTVALNSPTQFELTLINNSIAPHSVLVSSNLPLLWFQEKEITLKPGQETKVLLTVTSRTYGFKDFYFRLDSMENGSLIEIIPVHLNVNPVLKEKYATAFYGFPFFTAPLLPYYLINAFLSLIIP